ncbi:MAG: hypothetical protein FJY85_11495 [Deltaproteobacteria bacterium]|nr:hypothetical protein [Deltaproteobacteria bacterium]
MVGAVFLLIGVFAPIVSVPGLGSLNYFQVGSVTKGLAVCGHMLVALAVISLGLVILGKQVWLWLPGLGSLVLFLYTYARYRGLTRDLSIRVQYLTSSLESGLAVQPGTAEPPGVSGSLGDQTLSRLPDLVRLDWGWGLLIVGATLLLTAAVLRTRKRLIIEP